ncbi:MAG: hypothetical protein HY078_07110 [Elusimicrobia bacterium]|nr:hypothetical protein [Elusimicrobiota bacterium]
MKMSLKSLLAVAVLATAGTAYAAGELEFVAQVEQGVSRSVQAIRDRNNGMAKRIYDALKVHGRCDRSAFPTCVKLVGDVNTGNRQESGLRCATHTDLRAGRLISASCRLNQVHNAQAIWNALKDVQANCAPSIGGPCSKFIGGLSCTQSFRGRATDYSCRLNLPK